MVGDKPRQASDENQIHRTQSRQARDRRVRPVPDSNLSPIRPSSPVLFLRKASGQVSVLVPVSPYILLPETFSVQRQSSRMQGPVSIPHDVNRTGQVRSNRQSESLSFSFLFEIEYCTRNRKGKMTSMWDGIHGKQDSTKEMKIPNHRKEPKIRP